MPGIRTGVNSEVGCSAAVQLIEELDATSATFGPADLITIDRMRGVRPRRRFP